MKLKFLTIPAVACSLCMMSCGNNGGSSLPKINNETDSVSYYMGSVFSLGFWELQNAYPEMKKQSDSAEEFYKGVAAVLDMQKSDNFSYNEGLKAGLRLLEDLNRFENESDLKLNKPVFLAALKNALRSQDAIDPASMQASYQVLFDRISHRADAKITVSGEDNLIKYAKKNGMNQLGSNVWCKVITPGAGSTLSEETVVHISLEVVDDLGRVLVPPTEADIKMGELGFDPSSPVAGPIGTMKMGENAEFATTAKLAYGRECTQLGLKGDQVVIYKVHITEPGKSTGESSAAQAQK